MRRIFASIASLLLLAVIILPRPALAQDTPTISKYSYNWRQTTTTTTTTVTTTTTTSTLTSHSSSNDARPGCICRQHSRCGRNCACHGHSNSCACLARKQPRPPVRVFVRERVWRTVDMPETHRVFDEECQRYIELEHMVPKEILTWATREVTATWNERQRCYGYINAEGYFCPVQNPYEYRMR